MEENFLELLKWARFEAAEKMPYFASIVYGFNFVPSQDKSISSVACDRNMNFYYRDDIGVPFSPDECVGAVLHEAGHIFRKHIARGNFSEVDNSIWNLSADAIINEDLISLGIQLPKNVVTFKNLGIKKHTTTEDTYIALTKKMGTGDKNEKKQQPFSGECGSVSDGQKRDYEITQGVPESIAESIIAEAAENILERSNSFPGTVPKGILIQAYKIKAKSASLEKTIKKIIGSLFSEKVSGAMHSTYKRPSRRKHGEIVFPSLYDEETTLNIGVVLDSSGSMNGKRLSKGIGAISSMAKNIPMRVYATCADTRSYGVSIIEGRNIEKWFNNIQGGGGTDLLPGIIAVIQESRKTKLDAIIMFSDGEFFLPDKNPLNERIPIYLCLVSNPFGQKNSKYPSWIKVFKTNS